MDVVTDVVAGALDVVLDVVTGGLDVLDVVTGGGVAIRIHILYFQHVGDIKFNFKVLSDMSESIKMLNFSKINHFRFKLMLESVRDVLCIFLFVTERCFERHLLLTIYINVLYSFCFSKLVSCCSDILENLV